MLGELRKLCMGTADIAILSGSEFGDVGLCVGGLVAMTVDSHWYKELAHVNIETQNGILFARPL